MSDMNKYASIGEAITLRVDGQVFEAVVKDISVETFDRQYLLAIPSTGETLWVDNKVIKSILWRN